MHSCLRFHTKFLSERCAAEEAKLAALEVRDIRLRPKLAKACSEERAVFCKVSQLGVQCRQGMGARWVGGRGRRGAWASTRGLTACMLAREAPGLCVTPV